MRRLLGLVILMAVTWPHIAVMQCAVRGDTHRAHSSSVMVEHAPGPDCPPIMACNGAMIEVTIEDPVATTPLPPRLHPRPVTTTPTTADLATDPPPPRRPA